MVNNIVYSNNIVFICALIIITIFSKYNCNLPKKKSNCFKYTFLCCTFVIAFQLSAFMLINLKEKKLDGLINLIFAIQYILGALFLAFLYYTTLKSYSFKKILFSLLVVSLCTIMLIYNLFSGKIFHYSTEIGFYKGDLYFLYFLFCALLAIMMLVSLYKMHLSSFARKEIPVFFLLTSFFLAALIVQYTLVDPGTIWNYSVLFVILYYFFTYIIYLKYDSLTGCLSRTTYDREITEITNKSNATIVLIDIDILKSINDTNGHQVGDEAIITIAKIILNCFKDIGNVYRIGGDEFIIIIKRTTQSEIYELLKEMDKTLLEENANTPYLLSVSYGVSYYDKDGENSLLDTVREADQEMYEIKLRKKIEKNRLIQK